MSIIVVGGIYMKLIEAEGPGSNCLQGPFVSNQERDWLLVERDRLVSCYALVPGHVLGADHEVNGLPRRKIRHRHAVGGRIACLELRPPEVRPGRCAPPGEAEGLLVRCPGNVDV